MWTDDEGGTHTVAVPEPESYITKRSRARLQKNAASVWAWLEAQEERALEPVEQGARIAQEAGMDVPDSVLRTFFRDANWSDVRELDRALLDVDWIWRLDVLTMLEDIIDLDS